jgi:hypothetical protein
VPREQVDASTLSEVVERDLGLNPPTGMLEYHLPGVLDGGMIGVEEPMELATRHGEVDADPPAKG